MCDPFWTGIPAGSHLHVSVEENTGAGVRCRVVIDSGDASAAGACSLPVSFVIGPDTSGAVNVDLVSPGAEATVVVVSQVTDPAGNVIRGPDQCSIDVPEGGVTSTQIMFSV